MGVSIRDHEKILITVLIPRCTAEKQSSTMDSNEQFSIKNLLFTKAIPNYVIPVPTAGHKVYACTDCGDKFLFSSSYDYHINRKSVKIAYYCRNCNDLKTFYNRCNLLSHIRSHAFKTATINVSDLRLDLLPLNLYKRRIVTSASTSLSTKETLEGNKQGNQIPFCFECNIKISQNGSETLYESRKKHFMQVISEVYTCPLCLFTLPTSCALKSHLRFHFKFPPYICPECGKQLTCRSTNYPYDHECEGFMMMRATVRVKCPAAGCHLLHPNEFKEHLKNNHLKAVYKCPYCYMACLDEVMINNHIAKNHTPGNGKISFFQCEICPGKIITQIQKESHLKAHMAHNYMFPCWVCGKIFKDVFTLTTHHMSTHNLQTSVRSCIEKLLNIQKKNANKRKVYRVVKRCDQCKRSFSYKCKFEDIKKLPSECPYKCTATSGPGLQTLPVDESLTCHMCKNKMSQNWEEIKKHFIKFHEAHRCVDVKVILPKINIKKYLKAKEINTPKNSIRKRKPRKKRSQKNEMIPDQADKTTKQEMISNMGEFVCKICLHECDNKEFLEKHLTTHRDPCMAYQCMECGQSFVVKPSFSKHLLLEHSLSNVDNYISEKKCYNESALMKYQDKPVVNEPIRENQCKICRDQFDHSDDLEKHFRVHGMAFLMKNNPNKTVSP